VEKIDTGGESIYRRFLSRGGKRRENNGHSSGQISGCPDGKFANRDAEKYVCE
jgi:hypothetical protein